MSVLPEEKKKMYVVDFHSHILPHIDDGSDSRATTQELLLRSAQAGVDVMVATPHFYGYRQKLEHFLERREEAKQAAYSVLKPDLPKVLVGAEVAFFSGIEDLDGLEKLCIEHTNVLLVEMPFAPWSNYEVDVLTSLMLDRQLQVVIAHFERYSSFQKDRGLLERLAELRPYIQINAGTLVDWRRRRPWIKAFLEGRAHLLGSDCHNLTSRVPNLGEGRAMLSRKGGERLLHRIDMTGTRLLGL